MRVLLVGSSGPLDDLFVAEAVRRGHDVVVDAKLGAEEGRHRAVAAAGLSSTWLSEAPARGGAGPGTDAGTVPSSLPAATATADRPDVVAVLIPVVSSSTTHTYSEAVDRLVERLGPAVTTRVVVLSSVRVEEFAGPAWRRVWESMIVERLLRNPLLDLTRMEAGLGRSSLRWTVVRSMPTSRRGVGAPRQVYVGRLDRPRRVTPQALVRAFLDAAERIDLDQTIVEIG